MIESSSSIVYTFVLFFLLYSHVYSLRGIEGIQQENETFVTSNEMKLINARLKKINKPFVKSIKSPDGDIIDCVLIHLQPTFDLLELKETRPLDPPELPKGHGKKAGRKSEIRQLWHSKGESCPNGTIPIRRTSARELLRSKPISKVKNPTSGGHEYGVGYVQGEFYGAKAQLNLWKPNVVGHDFSLSQIWVVANGPNTQTLEAGWQIYPYRLGDNAPRLFSYWTPDNYGPRGCYDLKCPGFVQTNGEISLGAALDPISTYNRQQFDIEFMIWKVFYIDRPSAPDLDIDPKSGNWWLCVGDQVMGYWPRTLFTNLRDHATLVEYGGEVAYTDNLSKHTSTQMGSGHFPGEWFRKAAYIRNLEVVVQDNTLNEVSNLRLIARTPNCYNVISGNSSGWGTYIFFGGPGNNPNCT